jgi:hypothetical protein
MRGLPPIRMEEGASNYGLKDEALSRGSVMLGVEKEES